MSPKFTAIIPVSLSQRWLWIQLDQPLLQPQLLPLDLRIDATRFDPLVLDLDGDGIDFTSVTADGSSGITIDHDNDNSTAEIKSSWLNSSSTDDYFVVYSNDGASFTLLTEFYQINGSDAGSGFEAFSSASDVDNSGVISGSERDSLYLWQDL